MWVWDIHEVNFHQPVGTGDGRLPPVPVCLIAIPSYVEYFQNISEEAGPSKSLLLDSDFDTAI